MSNLIKRLRASSELDSCRACGDGFMDEIADELTTALTEAADTIERMLFSYQNSVATHDAEIEQLTAVLKDREAEIKSISGHLIYATDRNAKLERVLAAARIGVNSMAVLGNSHEWARDLIEAIADMEQT